MMRDDSEVQADFQFCYFWGPSERIKSISHLGTPVYMSPELLQVRFKNYGRHSYDPVTADIWACAVLLVATLTGAFPFDNRPGASVEEAEKEIL
jgi:serine/threonine protein kinase